MKSGAERGRAWSDGAGGHRVPADRDLLLGAVVQRQAEAERAALGDATATGEGRRPGSWSSLMLTVAEAPAEFAGWMTPADVLFTVKFSMSAVSLTLSLAMFTVAVPEIWFAGMVSVSGRQRRVVGARTSPCRRPC